MNGRQLATLSSSAFSGIWSLVVAAGAGGAPLPVATSFINLSDDTSSASTQAESSVSGNLTQDIKTGSEQKGYIRTQVTASASFGGILVPPVAFVAGMGDTKIDPADLPVLGLRQRAYTSGAASVTYFAQLSSIRTLPSTYQAFTVPITAELFTSASVTTTGFAAAVAGINVVTPLGNSTLAVARAQAGNSAGAFSDMEAISPVLRVRPDTLLEVVVSASGNTAPINDDGVGAFTAVADPTFTLNQEEFDRITSSAGLPPLALEEYYTIEFSPNLFVPEPTTMVILGVLGWGLAIRRPWK